MSEQPSTHSPDPDSVPAPEMPMPNDEITALRAERDRLQAQVLRAQADFQNLKRRTASDIDQALKRSLSTLFEQLFVALDNLELALATPEGRGDSAFAQGVRLTRDNLMRGLELSGVQRIAPTTMLDPMKQEAVATEPRDDVAPGTVLGVLREGYTYQGQVVRPAQVRVATRATPTAETR
ncbi:MAG: nucleotide exchange factor GrpE [Planctomycetes bacterium]|nr:nucleotide exchange factor GrpE [Planctomycetota bacterium]